MPNAIRLDFDPTVNPFGLVVRLETLALAGVVLLMLVTAGLMAGRARAAALRAGLEDGAAGLRRDDLILIAFGAVPGAVFGGRLGYGLIHLDYYQSDPGALVDPGRGSLSLTGALLLGTVTALAVARLVGAPLRSWLNLAPVPLLLGLGLGKLAMASGGGGQGAYSDSQWATSYVGPGPWGSLNPAEPAIPSQVIEGGLVLLALACLLLVPRLLRLRAGLQPRPGLRLAPAREWYLLSGRRRFATALAVWAAIRFGVAFTWRDARVAGPFSAEQLALAIVLAACLLALGRAWLTAAGRTLAFAAAGRVASLAASRAASREARAARQAAPEYPRQERGSEVEVVPERARVEPAEPAEPVERAARRRTTHRPRESGKSRRKRPGSGS